MPMKGLHRNVFEQIATIPFDKKSSMPVLFVGGYIYWWQPTQNVSRREAHEKQQD
jgi:hypothetical protein